MLQALQDYPTDPQPTDELVFVDHFQNQVRVLTTNTMLLLIVYPQCIVTINSISSLYCYY